ARAQIATDTATCMSAMLGAGAKLSTARTSVNLGCIKQKGKGTLAGLAESCLNEDPKQKVSKAESAVTSAFGFCPFGAPPFSTTDPLRMINGVELARTAVVHATFGYDLDSAVAACSADPAACSCQSKIIKAVEKFARTNQSLFLKCSKTNIYAATNADGLAACLDDPLHAGSVAADEKMKVAKGRTKLADTIAKSCTDSGVAIATAFPGVCSTSADAVSLATCLSRQVACRVCHQMNDTEALASDCDLFDDGLDNASCALLFAPSQHLDGQTVTCDSGENTATYTQCNNLKIQGLHM